MNRIIKFALILFVLYFPLALICGDVFESVTAGNTLEYMKSLKSQKDYPNSDRIILLSHFRTEMNEAGLVRTKIVQRSKILNERGYEQAKKTLSYREGYSNVRLIYANTIKPNGAVEKVEDKDIRDYSPFSDYEFYSDVKVKTFTFPSLEPGCVIELCWEREEYKSDFPFDSGSHFKYLSLNPMLLDSMEEIIPHNVQFKWRTYNQVPDPQISEVDGKTRYYFLNKDRGELIAEAAMPDFFDEKTFPVHRTWTLPAWSNVSEWYNRLMRKQMVKDDSLEEYTKELIKESNTDLEKTKAIFHFVSKKIRYVSVAMGPNTYEPHPANDIFRKKYGDCKDKTVLLMTMLKIAGIESCPALVPADSREFHEDMPSMGWFNHVMAEVKDGQGNSIWLDGTNEMQAVGGPVNYSWMTVMLIKPDGKYQFVRIDDPPEKENYYSTVTELKINSRGHGEIKSTLTRFGVAATRSRSDFKYTSPENMRRSFEQAGLEDLKLDQPDYDKLYEPFKYSYSGKMKNVAQIVDKNTIIISNPFSLGEFAAIVTAKTRKYPILFSGGLREFEEKEYILPEGFIARNLPEDFVVKRPWAEMSIKYKLDKNKFRASMEIKSVETSLEPGQFDFMKKCAEENVEFNRKYANIVFEKK